MSLEILLIFAFGGALLTYLLGKTSEKIRDFLAVVISLSLVAFVAYIYDLVLRYCHIDFRDTFCHFFLKLYEGQRMYRLLLFDVARC